MRNRKRSTGRDEGKEREVWERMKRERRNGKRKGRKGMQAGWSRRG